MIYERLGNAGLGKYCFVKMAQALGIQFIQGFNMFI